MGYRQRSKENGRRGRRAFGLLGLWPLVFVVFCLSIGSSSAQSRLKGRVLEAGTLAPVYGATVSLFESSSSTATDSLGGFELGLSSGGAQTATDIRIRVSALGYRDQEIRWQPGHAEPEILLQPVSEELDVVVIGGKTRYRSRGNAAVALIDEVIHHRAANRSDHLPYLEYRTYEKIMMAVSDLPRLIADNPLFRNYSYIFDNVDTALVEGRKLLPVYLEEKLMKEHRSAERGGRKTFVEAIRKTELDKRFVNNENIQTIVSHLHADIDLYANTILLLNRPFHSPIGVGAPLFYKYVIRDTVHLENADYFVIEFAPRNIEDRLFSGKLWISAEGRYAVRRADLFIGQRSNINWVNDVHISLDFARHDSGIYLPASMETKINFGLYGSRQGMFSHWTRRYEQYTFARTEPDVFHGQQLTVRPEAAHRTEEFWATERPVSLSHAEALTYQNIDSLQQNKSFLRTLRWVSLVMTSYKHLGPVQLGPLEYLYSFNELEGSRFRLGGRTTREWSENFYGEGYGAYGLADRRWKYYVGGAWTLNRRRIAEYPAHYVHVTWQNDAREPGHRPDFLNGDSFFRSFRRSNQDKWLYHQLFKARHIVEFGNHWRLESGLTVHQQEPAAALVFQRAGDGVHVPTLQTTEASLDLRWAPHEEYFQRNLVRTPIVNKYPIFSLHYRAGLKDLFGGDHAYHALRFDANKRWYFSLLGFSDIALGMGQLFGSVPFPLLEIPAADQSFLLAPDSYNLMNDLEFVSDQFLKFSIVHRFEGFFLNKVPFLKRLKVRELVSFKTFFGGLRPQNYPDRNPDLFRFPMDEVTGDPTTFALRRTPYMEASVGLENIFNFLRVEYVKRLSYLDHPDVKKAGVRFSVKLGF